MPCTALFVLQKLSFALSSHILSFDACPFFLFGYLLYQVLADSVDIPCCLVKGQLYVGFDDVAMNIVKIDDGR